MTNPCGRQEINLLGAHSSSLHTATFLIGRESPSFIIGGGREAILNDLIGDRAVTIDPETPLGDLIDSLRMVKLIVFIEDKLKIDLLEGDVDMKDFQSLNGITNLFQSNVIILCNVL